MAEKEKQNNEPQGFFKDLWKEWVRPILIILAVLIPFRSAVADWNDVPTGSMKPTILEGDRVVVNKLAYDLKVPLTRYRLAVWDNPERGDVVVLFSPRDGRRLVKRVIGLPGDEIETRNGVLFVNNESASYEEIDYSHFAGLDASEAHGSSFYQERLGNEEHPVMSLHYSNINRNFGPKVVPESNYFVMGDNRDNSADSREIGMIERERIIGKVVAVAFSLDRNDHYKPRFSRFFSGLD